MQMKFLAQHLVQRVEGSGPVSNLSFALKKKKKKKKKKYIYIYINTQLSETALIAPHHKQGCF